MFKYLKRALHEKNSEKAPDKFQVRVSHGTLLDQETEQQIRSRTSRGLLHFLERLPTPPETEGLQIFDLGGLVDSNVHYFLSQRGGRLYAVDLLDRVDAQHARLPQWKFDDLAALRFVDEYLSFQTAMFDAVLVWDVLHFLDAALLRQIVAKLARIVRPGGSILCFFHDQPKGAKVPLCRYTIEAANSLKATTRSQRPVPVTLSNRDLEALFQDFKSVQFFLSQDSLRELVVVR